MSKRGAQRVRQQRAANRSVSPMRSRAEAAEPGALSELKSGLMQNKPAVVGFGLSLLQLFGHASWVGLTSWLQSTGRAATLTPDDGMSWLVVSLLGLSLVLTCVAMFVCLGFGLRRSPRSLAVAGLCLSFFTGVLATTIVFMSAMRSMSEAV